MRLWSLPPTSRARSRLSTTGIWGLSSSSRTPRISCRGCREGDGLRVLEIACGTGILTRRLREALPESASVVATDLNEPMVAYARDAVPAPGIVWQQADAQALAFPDGSFDVAICQFGFMFLPDTVQGFREARRVLRADGVLLANVWQSLEANPEAGAIHATLAKLFPADPPRFLETPYGYHDTARIRADMAGGGLERRADRRRPPSGPRPRRCRLCSRLHAGLAARARACRTRRRRRCGHAGTHRRSDTARRRPAVPAGSCCNGDQRGALNGRPCDCCPANRTGSRSSSPPSWPAAAGRAACCSARPRRLR